MSIIDKYPLRTWTFPIEIVDLIFEQLYVNEDPHEQKIAGLKNMSLVCKAFVPTARRYIFRRIKLNMHQPSTGSETLCALPLARLLHKEPDISRFIRTLCLHDTRILADGQDNEPSTFWYSNGAVTPLYNLPRLSYLKIHLNSPRSYLKARPYGGLSFRRVLNHYICFDTLTVLNFWNINDLPFALILSAPSLTSLWISSCQMAPWVPPTTGVKPYPLEMLHFHDSKHLPLQLLFCFPNLKEYVMGEKLWDTPKSQFLKRGEEWPFPSLETLTLSSKNLGWFGQVILGVRQAEADPFPRIRALEYGTDWECEQIESFVDEVKTIEDLTVRMESTFRHSMIILPKSSSSQLG
ncbi:hypothetical protein BJ165DRAFT_1567515 [Panaeolus papilionaceus]|nr:hypothetical protein BJ165DRAFT_1567515 [Panaeolus papilionaceus]